MAGFSCALHRHACEQCVEQLYMASRVYTLQFLNLYDAFVDVLGKLATPAAPGEMNSAALNTGLIDLMSQVLQSKQTRKTSLTKFVSEGDHCSVTLTPQKNALLFNMLRAGKAGTFGILRAGPKATIDTNPFAAMAEVRLTHIRCRAKGMVTSDNIHCIEITHTGSETFVTEDGVDIQLHHNPVTVPCTYNAKTGKQTGDGALDKDHRMIGPFCQWMINIPASNKGLDLSGLKSIEIEFEGTCRAFAPSLSS
jgi:hypothetical protein